MLDDRLPCPALVRLLPALLPRDAACWAVPEFAVARDLKRVIVGIEPLVSTAAPQSVNGLLILGPLPWPVDLAVPSEVLEAVRPGAPVVELLTPRRLRWFAHRTDYYAAAADRVARWLGDGLVEVEQWVSVEPPDTLVTWGRSSVWAAKSR